MLTRRIFGVQAWVWAVVITAGIVAYAYLTRGRNALEPAPETHPFPDGSVPADAGDVPGVVVPGPGDTFRPETNPAWLRWVVDRMRISGEDPTLVHNAATKVLSGLEVTQQEAAMWNEIVRRFGPPPEGAPPIVITPTAPPTSTPPGAPKPAPPPAFWYTIPRGIVPPHQNGTSKVLDAAMKANGYPGGYADAPMRNRVWYHPSNAGVRAKHNNNPASMKMTESIFMPKAP